MAAAAGSAGGTDGEKAGRGKVLLLVLSVAAVAALVAGYVGNGILSGLVVTLPGLQGELEKCGDLAAEYLALRGQQVDPSGRYRYVRTMMEKIARELGIRGALGGTTETEVQRTDMFVETKYNTELKGVRLKDVAMFLYGIQTSGKNLVPAEITIRRQKESDMWTADLAVHAVSAVE